MEKNDHLIQICFFLKLELNRFSNKNLNDLMKTYFEFMALTGF